MMGKLYGSMWRTTVVQHKLVPHVQCPNYNGRKYPMRGWCVFEDGVACLAAGHRSEANRGAALGWGPWAGREQPKLIEISGFYPHVVDVPKAPKLKELEGRLAKATFTGAGDRDVVMGMLKEFNTLLDIAAKPTGDAKAIAQVRRQNMRRGRSGRGLGMLSLREAKVAPSLAPSSE